MGLVLLARRRILQSLRINHHYSCCLRLPYITFGSVGSQVRPRSGTDLAETPTDRSDVMRMGQSHVVTVGV